MKVYFTASTDSALTEDGIAGILKRIESLGHQLISGRQIVQKQELSKDKRKAPERIFSRQKQAIDTCDCVIAEVSTPSSGVGGEIVYSLMKNKPVLALFYKDAENDLTPMIAGNPSSYLYLEHYDDGNVKTVLKQFLAQVVTLKNRKGKLIVIDGGDGSGKTTQSQMIIDYLEKQGQQVTYVDYPRYYTSFHGRVVGRFLAGEFGTLDEVSPYLSSLAYAIDRAGTKDEMDECLSMGGIIIANRYATSSIAHQAAKMPEEKRREFIDWLDELEYKVHKIPREDIVIYLYVPWKVGMELTGKKGARKYLNGQAADIAEKDMKHRIESEKMYLKLASERGNWVKIDCVKNGKILPKEVIHRQVLDTLRRKKIIL